MKKIIFLLILLKIPSLGQDTTKNKLILKFSPLAAFDRDNTLQLGIEHRLRNKWTLTEEFGYGKGTWGMWGIDWVEENKYREIWRAKIEARKYLRGGEFPSGMFIGYELMFKQINDVINRGVGRECEFGCNYYEQLNYLAQKYVAAGHVKLGFQHRFRNESKKNTNFVFDYYIGVGLRRKIIRHQEDFPQNSGSDFYYFGNESMFTNRGMGSKDQAYNLPSGVLGFRLGYIVR